MDKSKFELMLPDGETMEPQAMQTVTGNYSAISDWRKELDSDGINLNTTMALGFLPIPVFLGAAVFDSNILFSVAISIPALLAWTLLRPVLPNFTTQEVKKYARKLQYDKRVNSNLLYVKEDKGQAYKDSSFRKCKTYYGLYANSKIVSIRTKRLDGRLSFYVEVFEPEHTTKKQWDIWESAFNSAKTIEQ